MAKILIVCDKVTSDALSVFLLRAGHEVFTAGNRVSGLQLCRSQSPDLAIVDRDLPGIAGKGGLDQLGKFCGGTPVIVLSGCRSNSEADACLRCGAAAYLPKSEGLSPVLDEADRLLGRVKICPPPEGAGKARSKPLVLVADDEAGVCDLLASFLSSIGCEVLTAFDAPSAEALARSRKPDIVLLDIFMPGQNGHEILPALREGAPGAGVIMISGNDDEQLARRCLREGAFEYLQKPLNLEALGKAIKARLLLQAS